MKIVQQFHGNTKKFPYNEILNSFSVNEIPDNSFRLVVETVKVPEWLESQMIFAELYAEKKSSYWLDSSKVSLKPFKKNLFFQGRTIFQMEDFL